MIPFTSARVIYKPGTLNVANRILTGGPACLAVRLNIAEPQIADTG
jgi:hypothetical protein